VTLVKSGELDSDGPVPLVENPRRISVSQDTSFIALKDRALNVFMLQQGALVKKLCKITHTRGYEIEYRSDSDNLLQVRAVIAGFSDSGEPISLDISETFEILQI